jgi:hypothetical protein
MVDKFFLPSFLIQPREAVESLLVFTHDYYDSSAGRAAFKMWRSGGDSFVGDERALGFGTNRAPSP